jgi:light-regulated signal transduction histidine kinase (bacteriophytochrome)
MSASSTIDRLFMAIIERQEASFDTLKAGNERYHRFVRSVVEGMRQGVHEWTSVARGWSEKPADVVGLYESASEAIANSQARRLALWQEMIEDLAESQREGREVMRRGLGEVREAVERVQENVPSFLRDRVASLRSNDAQPVAKEA